MSAASVTRDDLIGALIVAKCARWMMGTCLTREVPEAEWCAVCEVLNRVGYEPVGVSDGGLETWQLVEADRA